MAKGDFASRVREAAQARSARDLAQQIHDELVGKIAAEARSLGELVYFTRDSRRAPPGYPDLTIAGRRGVLWAEVKSERGKMQPRQQDWRYMLQASGQQWRLWRPADWTSGQIHADLRDIA